jgi:hypothetical protein
MQVVVNKAKLSVIISFVIRSVLIHTLISILNQDSTTVNRSAYLVTVCLHNNSAVADPLQLFAFRRRMSRVNNVLPVTQERVIIHVAEADTQFIYPQDERLH